MDNRNAPSDQEKRVRYFPTLRKLTVSSNVSHSQVRILQYWYLFDTLISSRCSSSWWWLATPLSCLIFRPGSTAGSQQDSSPPSSSSTPLSNSSFYGTVLIKCFLSVKLWKQIHVFPSIDCTKNLCPTVLLLLLKNAKSLESLIGVETWQKMDPRFVILFLSKTYPDFDLFSICEKMNVIFEKKNLPHRLISYADCKNIFWKIALHLTKKRGSHDATLSVSAARFYM